MVTWDSIVRWTENASKYKIDLNSVYVHGNFKCNIRFIGISYNYIVNKYGIYMKSVYLTWKTWDLTERWNKNESKWKIELKSLYLTW